MKVKDVIGLGAKTLEGCC